MGCKFVQRCGYKWLCRNCLGLDLANLMICFFQKMAVKSPYKIFMFFFFFFNFLKNINSQKIKWRWAGRWRPEEGAEICGQVEFSHFAFCAFLRQRSAPWAAGHSPSCARGERERERELERGAALDPCGGGVCL